jgi:hypothetical protein
MKQTALILLAIVLVAAIAFGLLVATLPKANVTIRAIGPTGDLVTRTKRFGKQMRCPLWQFAITNTGRANVHWAASLQLKGPTPTQEDAVRDVANLPFGDLAPGSGVVTNMPVPPQDDIMWSGTIQYWRTPGRHETKLWIMGQRKRWLTKLLPSPGPHFSSDVWHTTTNVAPISALPQNGPNP